MQIKSLVSRFAGAAALMGCLGGAMAADGPLWFEGGRPDAQARQAVELLAAAASHGLEPQDYNARALMQAVTRAAQGLPPEPATLARLEPALTAAMAHYLVDLHQGRIDPRQIHHHFDSRRDAFDPQAYLQTAVAQNRLAEAAQEAAPRLPLYERLRETLAQYREKVNHPAWGQPLPALPGAQRGGGGKLAPGQSYAGLVLLAQRLAALDDLAPDLPLPPRYEGALVEAVQAFQRRHGLGADGVIGKA
ncbi:MAG: peptidoglycan-binding protein, partial [Polaromonas sp.]